MLSCFLTTCAKSMHLEPIRLVGGGGGGKHKSSHPSRILYSPPPPFRPHFFLLRHCILYANHVRTCCVSGLGASFSSYVPVRLSSNIMGGSTVRYEPANLDTLLLHPEAYQIFLQAGWISYFKKLKGFNEDEVLEFSQNLTEGYSMVNGVRIPVSEESIAAVTGLPTTGDRWFNRKTHLWMLRRVSSLTMSKFRPKAEVWMSIPYQSHGGKLQSLSKGTLPAKAGTKLFIFLISSYYHICDIRNS
jgi:hypothetical protein